MENLQGSILSVITLVQGSAPRTGERTIIRKYFHRNFKNTVNTENRTLKPQNFCSVTLSYHPPPLRKLSSA